MTCKERRQERQKEKDLKIAESILSGKSTIVYYDRPKKPAQANRKGGGAGSEEEKKIMTERYFRLLMFILPGIIEQLSTIKDPRSSVKIVYSVATLMGYGLLMFLSHMGSRRAANRELGGILPTDPLLEYITQIDAMPHADTLYRLLSVIDPEEIEKRYEEILKQFIRSDAFLKLNPGRMLVAIDGSQKFSRNYCWDDNALSRNANVAGKERYSAYMLESVLIIDEYIVIPLLTEPLENDGSDDRKMHNEGQKQDCELKAFHRLSERLVKLLGKGCVTLVMDGLYANGPVISKCNQYGWEYMITLKRDSLKTVWEEFNGLREIEPENTLDAKWGDRVQTYQWVNSIEYRYGGNHKKLSLNVATCSESWIEMHPRSGGKPELKKAEYSWLSSEKLTSHNISQRCTKIARHRWKIENNFLIEKHQGYYYSHCYSYNWNAMKGYHYLMKIAHFINVLITHSKLTSEYVTLEGYRGFVKKVWKTATELTCKISNEKAATPSKSRFQFNKLDLKAG